MANKLMYFLNLHWFYTKLPFSRLQLMVETYRPYSTSFGPSPSRDLDCVLLYDLDPLVHSHVTLNDLLSVILIWSLSPWLQVALLLAKENNLIEKYNDICHLILVNYLSGIQERYMKCNFIYLLDVDDCCAIFTRDNKSGHISEISWSQEGKYLSCLNLTNFDKNGYSIRGYIDKICQNGNIYHV